MDNHAPYAFSAQSDVDNKIEYHGNIVNPVKYTNPPSADKTI